MTKLYHPCKQTCSGYKQGGEEALRDLDEEFFLDIITKWKFEWMDVKGTDERDRSNYYSRAFGVDANMKYSLARMLEKAVKEKTK